MNQNFVYPIINTVGIIAVIIINAFVNILPLGGSTTGEVSQRYTNLFVPAGYAFSIWAIIYLLLVNFVIYGWFNHHTVLNFKTISIYFVLTCLFNIVWLFLWHHDKIWFSTIAMVGLLSTLIKIYTIVQQTVDTGDTWTMISLQVSFSVYLAWVSVATVANFSAALTSMGWDGFGLTEEFWFVTVLFVILVITIFITLLFRDFAFMTVIIWALIAIIFNYKENTIVVYVTSIEVLIVVLTFLYFLIQ